MTYPETELEESWWAWMQPYPPFCLQIGYGSKSITFPVRISIQIRDPELLTMPKRDKSFIRKPIVDRIYHAMKEINPDFAKEDFEKILQHRVFDLLW